MRDPQDTTQEPAPSRRTRPGIALVGCGRWGRNILRDLIALGCPVTVADPDEAARRAAVEAGAVAAVAGASLLPRVDGIVVATPTSTHAEVVESLLARDVPVFVEKPLTADPESALRLAAAAPDRLFVMDKWRYHPGVEALAAVARSGELGPVVGLRSTREGWGSPQADVDPIWTLVPHELSIAVEVLGLLPQPRAAYADRVDGRLLGLVGLLGDTPWFKCEVSTRQTAYRREVHLHCRDGVATLPGSDSDHIVIARGTGEAPPQVEQRAISRELPLQRELAAFVRHLEGGPSPRTSAADGAAIVSVVAELAVLARAGGTRPMAPLPAPLPSRSPHPRRDALAAVSAALLAFAIFLASPVRQVTDSHYSLLLSENLYRHGTGVLNRYFVPPLDPTRYPGLIPPGGDAPPPRKVGFPYLIDFIGSEMHYRPPPGSAVLSIPFVAAFNALGLSAVAPDGGYSREGEEQMEALLAALLSAAVVGILVHIARLFLPLSWSLVAALGAALGGPIWSTASRALWNHTWSTLLLGLAVYVLARAAVEGREARPILLAVLLSGAVYCRPSNAVFAVAVSIYVLVRDRRAFEVLLVSGLAGLAGLMVYTWVGRGALLPDYYHGRTVTFGPFWEALAAHLVSPSRGLLTFSPWVVLGPALLARRRAGTSQRPLVYLALAAILLQLVAISLARSWWSGHCYGPRFSTEIMPWAFLLACLGLAALRAAGPPRALPLLLAVTLTAWSIFANGAGALSWATVVWNATPVPIETDPGRIWQWSDPQFLAFARE
jgi:predicted dehydrogenase